MAEWIAVLQTLKSSSWFYVEKQLAFLQPLLAFSPPTVRHMSLQHPLTSYRKAQIYNWSCDVMSFLSSSKTERRTIHLYII